MSSANIPKRRLFPLRRTSLSSVKALHKNVSPLDILRLPNSSEAESCLDDLSDGEYSSSSGTVKINGVSDLDLSDSERRTPEQDFTCTSVFHSPYELKYRAEQNDIPGDQVPPTTPCPKSSILANSGQVMSAPSKWNKRITPGVVRSDPATAVRSPGHSLGFESSRSLPDLRTDRREQHRIKHKIETNHSVVPLSADHVCVDNRIHHVNEWDMAVTLSTVSTMSEEGGINIHHHAQLRIELLEANISAQHFSLNLIVSNCLRGSGVYRLAQGESSLFLEEDMSQPFIQNQGKELVIIRNKSDKQLPLHLYLLLKFRKARSDIVASLPTFHPRNGNVVSESIFLSEPKLPLIMTASASKQYNSWRSQRSSANKVIHFERLSMPTRYPDSLQDDLCIEIKVPSPIDFWALGDLPSADVAWNMDIRVQQVTGSGFRCHMSLRLEVGIVNKLLTLDSEGWIPSFFLVGGRLTSKAGGEWREDSGHLILLKQGHMLQGPIKVEMNWSEPTSMSPLWENPDGIALPRVVDRAVLNGSLACEHLSFVMLTNPGPKAQSFFFDAATGVQLPTLHKGYKVYLENPNYGPGPPPAPLPEDDELSTTSDLLLRENLNPQPLDTYERKCEDGLAMGTMSHLTFKPLTVNACFVLLLFLSFPLVRTYVRLRNDPIINSNSRSTGSNVFLSGEIGEGAALDTQPNTPLHKDFLGDRHVNQNTEDVEGWRDWLDSALGWKGYTL